MKNSGSHASGSAVRRYLPEPLAVFLRVALPLLAIALGMEAFCRFVFHLGPPYRSPLLNEHYPDYLGLIPRLQYFHTLQFFTDTTDPPCMYPAPVAVCYWLLFKFSHSVYPFLTLVVSCFVVSSVLLGRALVRRGLGRRVTMSLLAFALATSFPLWFELKQANMEIWSWILLAVGVWSLFRRHGYAAALCFGLAGALKLTPFFYLGIFVARRQFRHVLVALLAAAALTIPSLWLVYPHVAQSWHLTNIAVSHFREMVTLRIYPQLAFDHSIFALIKRVIVRYLNAHHLSMVLTAYSVLAALLLLALFFGWIRKLPLVNQVLCLCLATLLVPPTSFDYTLMSLYLPWSLLVLLAVEDWKMERTTPGLIAAMACFAVLFVPETEVILRGQSVGGQIKAVTLLALLWIGLHKPFRLAPSASEVTA